MTHLEQLENPEYRNWVKGVLSLKYLRDGIEEFVDKLVQSEHHRILTQIDATSERKCQNCTLVNLKPVHKSTSNPSTGKKTCPKGQRKCNCLAENKKKCKANICDKIYEEILESHASSPPSPYWKNTDISKWTTHPWEIGKCFINAQGYADIENSKDIDVAGLLHILINNINFQEHISPPQRDLLSKTLQTRNSIFHSPSMELQTQALDTCIGDIIAILKDDKELKDIDSAKQAVENIRKLKDQDFIITTQTETEICKLAMLSIAQEKEELRKVIQETKQDIASKQDMAKLEEAVLTLEKRIKEIEDRTKQGEISDVQHKAKDITPDLQEDLITYYRANESTIPAAPLVESQHVPLMKLYVRPPMRIVENSDNKHIKEKHANNTPPITSYRRLFVSDEGIPFRNIYVTANAGMGKTSFSQHLTMTWCQAHSPEESLRKKFEEDDISVMKQFEICFLIHLRDYHGCNADDLVCEFLSRHISRQFSGHSIEDVLHEKYCLLILDGLDEWSHPGTCPRRDEGIPHRKTRKRCTVLTTTRPWKLSIAELRSTPIEYHVEISELDIKSSEKLDKRAVKLLNSRIQKGEEQKNIADLKYNSSLAKLENLRFIPYIKLQAICLWFDGMPMGKSKCEIYSNVVELTLARGLKKSDLPPIQTSSPAMPYELPKCMAKNRLCTSHNCLLYKLGKIAFDAFFHEMKEFMLVIKRETALAYLENDELEYLLKIGLLSQSKDYRLIARECHKVFFQHKSVQEFFTALYISLECQNETTKTTLLKVCRSLNDILEMSNVFVFVSGMNPETYFDIGSTFKSTVANDKDILAYRSMLNDYDKKMIDFQSMQFECLDEQLNNGHLNCSVSIPDIILHDTVINTQLQLINKDNLVSICLNRFKKVFLDKDTDLLPSLETFIALNFSKAELINRILAGSAKTLKYVTLNVNGNEFISTSVLTSMSCLQYVDMADLKFTHNDMKQLFSSLENWKMVTCLKLEHIRCSDHRLSCTGVTFDISHMEKLQLLHLSDVVFSKVLLNNKSLVTFKNNHTSVITPLTMSHDSIQQFFNLICEGKSLEKLCLHHIQCLDHVIEYPERSPDCSGTMLDLSGLNSLEKLELGMIPVCGLSWSTDALTTCDINFSPFAQTYRVFTHKNLQLLYDSIANSRNLTYLRIYCIECFEHKSMCKNLNLDLSRLSNLETLDLKNIPISGLRLNTEAPMTCRIDCSILSIFVLSKSSQNFSISIGKGKSLKKLCVKCPKRSFDCRDAILDLSGLNSLHTLELDMIPVFGLSGSTDSLKICDMNFSFYCPQTDQVSTRKNIQRLYSSIANCRNLTYLRIYNKDSNIDLSRHRKVETLPYNNCFLNLSRHKYLEHVYLKEIPLGDIFLNIDALLTCEIAGILTPLDMSHESIQELFISIANGRKLKKIHLDKIRCSEHQDFNEMCNISLDETDCTITTWPWNKLFQWIGALMNPKTLTVRKVDFGDSVLSLCSDINNCFSLVLFDVTIFASGCRELLRSVGKLNGSTVRVSVDLINTFMTMSAQRKLFIYKINCVPWSITIIPNIRSIDRISSELTTVTPLSELREILTMFICLPQSLTVEFNNATMEISDWMELLHNTLLKLPRSVKVHTKSCNGLTLGEWNSIVNEIKSSKEFWIDQELEIKNISNVCFTFYTVEPYGIKRPNTQEEFDNM